MTQEDRTPAGTSQGEGHPQITWLRHDDLNCPHFICCACGEPIKEGKQGIAEWRYDADHRTVIEWRVRHKGHWCASAWEIRQVPRAQWYWDNLELVLDQLLYNTVGRVPPT